jgi:hypothetical protein
LLDTNPPEWPANSALTASEIGLTSLTLTWTPAFNNLGPIAYRLYLGSRQLASFPGNVFNYQVVGLMPGTIYTFKVEAGDRASNWSRDGPSAKVTTIEQQDEASIATFLRHYWRSIAVVAGVVLVSATFLTRVRRPRKTLD